MTVQKIEPTTKNNKAIEELKQLIILILAATAIIYWRSPIFFHLPRVFAEEPGSYLLNALVNPLPESLGYTMAGYFSIVPNLTAELAAKAFPLEYAAHIFTIVGLLIQLLTVISIYYSVGRILPNRAYSALTAIFLLAIAKPTTWLNTVYSMYWLATGMFFILNAKNITRFHLAYSGLSFLTGPTSLIWLPFFGLRWFTGYNRLRQKEKSVGIICLTGIAALGINIYLSFLSIRYSSFGGESRLNAEMLANLPRGFASMFAHLFASGGYPFALGLVSMIMFGILILAVIATSDWRTKIFSIAAIAYYAFVTSFLSFEMQGGNRYALPITTAIFSLSVLCLSKLLLEEARSKRKKRRIALFMLILLFLMGNKLIEFHDFSGDISESNYVYDQKWPNWYQQIKAINRTQGGVIKTFPQWGDTNLQGGDWHFELPGKVGR